MSATTTETEQQQSEVVLTLSGAEEGGAFFSMGLQTHRVPMSLHAQNRRRLLERFTGCPEVCFTCTRPIPRA